MRSLILTVTAAFGLLLSAGGCKDAIFYPDVTPPAPPRGITTATGDGFVEVFWLKNSEQDVYGYNVYASSSFTGTYELIGFSRTPYFLDNGVANGRTYYYAVTAYDNSGNESDLSPDVAYDTPRPEGIDVPLTNYRANANLAGYDFSTYSVGPYDDPYTDVFFENYNGAYFLNVWDDTEIQDMGYTRSLYDIGYAPEAGWAPTKDAPVIPGHTYVIWTYDNHFAKLRVTQVSGTKVMFDWAYQLQQGNPRLKPAAERGALTLGAGAASRQ